ncbi:MAG: glucose-6-phosphate isomerase [Anaerolineae bacterium]|jgi:glucose-6-phosphate isomerase|nr:glucose-6-phosphate isomerase [Anaerolineae bacterium]
MQTVPFTYRIPASGETPAGYDRHLTRRLSSLRGFFQDGAAFEKEISLGDTLVYEVYEINRPENSGELQTGLSIVHPGLIGDEYYMTKGHFHAELQTAEIYHCLQGEGVMVMENMDGEWAVEELRPGVVLYILPGWAHRSVNTGHDEDLITYFAYPGHAGHDYATIETQGFRKIMLERDGRPCIVDNPRWVAPGSR